jgi:hypothetical protein
MTEDRLKELRDKLFRATEGYDGDESIRAMASALSSLIIGCTADRTAALAALDRIYGAMRGHIQDAAQTPEDREAVSAPADVKGR